MNEPLNEMLRRNYIPSPLPECPRVESERRALRNAKRTLEHLPLNPMRYRGVDIRLFTRDEICKIIVHYIQDNERLPY